MKKFYKFINILAIAAVACIAFQSCGPTKYGCPERMNIDITK